MLDAGGRYRDAQGKHHDNPKHALIAEPPRDNGRRGNGDKHHQKADADVELKQCAGRLLIDLGPLNGRGRKTEVGKHPEEAGYRNRHPDQAEIPRQQQARRDGGGGQLQAHPDDLPPKADDTAPHCPTAEVGHEVLGLKRAREPAGFAKRD